MNTYRNTNIKSQEIAEIAMQLKRQPFVELQHGLSVRREAKRSGYHYIVFNGDVVGMGNSLLNALSDAEYLV